MTSPNLAGELSSDVVAEAISWRHHLHKHPELAFNEIQTADFIASCLGQFGYTLHRGLGGTGVIGTLTRGTSRRAIAIRADMDALPIQEQSSAPHASCNPGVTHACGHDGHVAIALAAARACARLPELDGTVHFIFQPAEEGAGGARRMIEDGLFRMFPCDAIYALHNWPALPVGTCAVPDGAILAAFGVFTIVISGRGCHGALPHEGTDPIVAGCQLVTALQTVVSRNIDPRQAAIISVTQVRAGDTWNVIPDTYSIKGTTRWFTKEVGDMIESRLTQLSQSIAGSFGCKAEVSYERRSPATINDRRVASFVRTVASDSPLSLSLVDIAPSTGSEDFAFMLNEVPGCYLLLGAGRPKDNQNLHSPGFDFNDEALAIGAELWVAIVRKSLAPG